MTNFIFRNNIETELKQIISNYQEDKIFVLCDENTAKYCYPKIEAFLPVRSEMISVPAGEKSKNINTALFLWRHLNSKQADRKSLLINLGGGMITDLGGFVASTYKRGIDFLNIPTTLLAQVDASIGGKTGIDLDDFKNIVGVFSNPVSVIISADFLTTLDTRQIMSGFAEMIKHSLIFSKSSWSKIKSINPEQIDFDFLQILIKESVDIKNDFVKQDPYEKLGIREALNFGHTIGHAVETFLNKKGVQIFHGEAVAIGMISELFISNKILGFNFERLFEISEYLATHFRSFDIAYDDYEEIIQIMRHDKKNKNNEIIFTLLKDIGDYALDQRCSVDEIIQSLNFYYQVRK
jgi:3-dehydroquinate synthase